MKKVKIALLILVAAVMVLPACKKGAEDPFLSFRSRDARLMQTWKLTDIKGKWNNNTITYDGSNVTSNGNTIYTNATYSMTFAKDGVFNYTETTTIDVAGATPETITFKSYWTWLNSNKNKDFLQCTTGLANFVSYNPSTSYNTFYVDCLKESTLKIEMDDETSTNDNSLTFTFSH